MHILAVRMLKGFINITLMTDVMGLEKIEK